MPYNSNEAHVLKVASSLVNTWRLQGNWQDARILLNGLHPVATKVAQSAMANVWLQIGRVMTDEGMFGGKDTLKERQEAFDQALALAEPTKNVSLIGSVYDAMGFSIHAAYIDGDRSQEPENELDFFERGLELRKKGGTVGQVAESLFHVGLVFDVIRKDYAQALPYHEEAYELACEAKDKVIASYAIRHIGFARLAADELAAAKQAFAESLELREAAGFTPGVAFALATLAHVDTLECDKTRARSRLERSRTILESLGATSRVAWIDNQMRSLVEA
jgi:tetratricopeptide (TPR) repeat protein